MNDDVHWRGHQSSDVFAPRFREDGTGYVVFPTMCGIGVEFRQLAYTHQKHLYKVVTCTACVLLHLEQEAKRGDHTDEWATTSNR